MPVLLVEEDPKRLRVLHTTKDEALLVQLHGRSRLAEDPTAARITVCNNGCGRSTAGFPMPCTRCHQLHQARP